MEYSRASKHPGDEDSTGRDYGVNASFSLGYNNYLCGLGYMGIGIYKMNLESCLCAVPSYDYLSFFRRFGIRM
jgi:hypothetical protein